MQTDALDLSDLTDDQIVELAVALAREAMRRNPALQAAFQTALLDEQERVAAALRGTQEAKRAAAQQLKEQARHAEAQRQAELQRQRMQQALSEYLRRGAAITGRAARDVTLVYTPNGSRSGGPCVQLNQGATGAQASWHLVDYVHARQALYTSPALQVQHAELLAWARETHAAISALGITRETVIKGIEL